MYCNNCGKQLNNDAKFCEFCGKMINVTNNDTNNKKYESSKFGANNTKPLIPKYVAYIIGGVALALVIFSMLISAVSNYIVNKNIPKSYHNHIEQYFDDFEDKWDRDYNDDDDEPWDYFDDYNDYYGNHGGGSYGAPFGNYGSNGSNGSGGTMPDATAAPKPTAGPWWPADENGKTPTDEGYKWPSGDGTYEYYMNSTIPKFESVTGASLKDTDYEDGNIYYTYDMSEESYKKYIEVIKERGFKQSEFEAKGKNSYEMYTLGDEYFYEYLVIYHMNSSNEIVIMA